MSETVLSEETKGTIVIRKKPILIRMYGMRYYYILLLPALIYFVLFHYKPMYGLLIAFKDYKILKGIIGSPWIGFENFERLFISPIFHRVLKNTIIISVLRIVFGFPAPIIFALILNEIYHVRFKKVVQTISYLPHFISWVVLGGIFKEILSPTRGAVNFVLRFLGGESIFFLTRPEWFRPILISTGVWQSIGWGSIIYLAAISSIDAQLYEAAIIDGANRFQQIRRITLPSITHVITILFILGLASVLNAGFDQIFNLYNPMVYATGDIIDTYVYRIGLINAQYSFSTAVSLFKNLIGLILVLAVNAVVARFSEYTIW